VRAAISCDINGLMHNLARQFPPNQSKQWIARIYSSENTYVAQRVGSLRPPSSNPEPPTSTFVDILARKPRSG
jgi:hypothetical protein